MKKQGFKSIYLKFVAIFVGILWLSSTIAFIISFGITADNLRNSFQERIEEKAAQIRVFCIQNSFPPKELEHIANEDILEVLVFYSIDDLASNKSFNIQLTQEQINILNNGGKIEGSYDRMMRLPYVVFKLNDQIVFITPRRDRNIFQVVRGVISVVLIICAGLGSLFIAIAVRMIVRPIKKLTAATKEVAKGNFDIEIKTRSRDEVGQLADNFNIMTKELKNIQYLRKDFISSVSHEFKTPMTSIQGFAKLIKNRKLSQEQFEEYTDIIISETGRLANLSSNLLKLANLENQAIQEQSTIFSIDEQIRMVILLLENKWSTKNIEFDLDLDEVAYTGDEDLLKQVWINLITNAIKFSYDYGEIKISLKKEGNIIKTSIADNGIGIPEDDKARIFEKFYKGDKSRTAEGSGLGLSIVKKIIERSSGRIYFESKAGKGTKFTVELYTNSHN